MQRHDDDHGPIVDAWERADDEDIVALGNNACMREVGSSQTGITATALTGADGLDFGADPVGQYGGDLGPLTGGHSREQYIAENLGQRLA